ncbi:MAG: EthD family reductase [Anaerolineae bacterium]|jgi:hypothetical protein|nr:EthD family reductase [Anaerolineae bacterium]
MFKLMILFRQPTDTFAFEDTYNNLLALVERMPNIIRRQVVHVTGSPSGASPYYRVLEAYFATQDVLFSALLSKQGQEAGGELAKLIPGTFEVVFAEVYEEQGGFTPGAQS